MTRLGPDCRHLLSILAHAGHRDGDAARRSFAEAAGRLPGLDLTLLSRGECGLRRLDTALDRLALAAPRLKRDVIRACATCVAADRTVTVNEAELLRAVAAVLGCPMPPLLPGQPVVDRGPAAGG